MRLFLVLLVTDAKFQLPSCKALCRGTEGVEFSSVAIKSGIYQWLSGPAFVGVSLQVTLSCLDDRVSYLLAGSI